MQPTEQRIKELEAAVARLVSQTKFPYDFTRTITSRRDQLVRNRFDYIDTGTKTFFVKPGGNIQTAIEKARLVGGGNVTLTAGTYSPLTDLTLYSNINLVGIGSGATIIDFGATSNSVKALGSNGYETGSVTVANGATSVVGTTTVWTSAMIGRSIMLEDFWYTISAVADNTHLTISTAYIGTSLTTFRYAIATLISNVHVERMTIQNSTGSLLKMKYMNNVAYYDVTCDTGVIGFDHQWVTNINSFLLVAINCTLGWQLNDTALGMWIGFNTFSCVTGFSANYFRNSAIDVFAVQSCSGIGMKFSNTNNSAFSNFSVGFNGSHGIELVAGNQFGLSGGILNHNTGDGLKLTATSDYCKVFGCDIESNGGWGINNAAATNDGNLFALNSFVSNGSGAINDSGTGTVINANVGV